MLSKTRPVSRLAVLLFTDIVGSTALKSQLGTNAYVRMLARHDELFRQCVEACPGAEILADSGDGYFAGFPTVSDAVRAALCFQHALHHEPWDGPPLRTRVGIHVGEVAEVSPAGSPGTKPKVVGGSADRAARLMSLAGGGQILLTRPAFDDARQFVHEHPETNGRPPPVLKWVAHGEYLFKGIDEPVEVFEVGGEGIASFAAPEGSEKARRSVSAEQEETLGWRPAVGLPVPQRQGWTLDRKLGEGTFGEVWLARHERLKDSRVFKFCFDTERLRSFKRELTFFRLIRDALGERPDIARLYDVRLEHPPYFLESEYAPGGNLIDWAEAQGGLGRVPLDVRIEMVAKVATAVAAAHSVGVLHKDIKPGNILIHADRDGTPQPQLSDFGIGLLVNPERLGDHSITRAGLTDMDPRSAAMTGTPLYSPPESLSGRPFTMQGDVYALGVLLYQMVVGDLTRPVSVGWEREVTDELLREDIAACIEGDPSRRLSSAGDLASRLRALPERRRKRTSARRAIDAARRRRRLLRIGVTVGLLACVFGALAAIAFVQERRLRLRAESSERRAQLAYADGAIEQGRALHLVGRGIQSRSAYVRARDVLLSLGESTLHAEIGLWRSFRDFEPPINSLIGHSEMATACAWFPDGLRACSASGDGTLRTWDARTGAPLGVLTGHDRTVLAVAVSPDGRQLLSSGADKTVRLWDADEGKEIRTIAKLPSEVRGVAFSPDGRLAFFGPAAKGAGGPQLWDLSTGRVVRTFDLPDMYGVYGVAFSHDGSRVAAGTYQKPIFVWDARTGQVIHKLSGDDGHGNYVTSVAFSPDDRYCASASFDRTIKLWDAESGRLVRSFTGHAAGVRGVAFVGARGDAILSGSMDGQLRLWDIATGQTMRTFAGHQEGVMGVAVSRDGRRALSAGRDRVLNVWNLARNTEIPTTRESGTVTSLAASSDGLTFVSGDSTGTVRLRDAATLRTLRSYTGHTTPIDCAVLLPDGRRVFAADSTGGYRIWDVSAARELAAFAGDGPGEVRELRGGAWSFTAVSPDGRLAVTSRSDRRIDVRNVDTGTVVRTLAASDKGITSVDVSPDGRYALSAEAEGGLSMWDLADGRRLLAKSAVHEPARLGSVRFTPDGRRAVTGGHELFVRLWDLPSGREVREFAGPTQTVKGVAVCHGGRIVVAVGGDQTLQMWDAATGRELDLGADAPAPGYSIAVLPPGDVVLAASGSTVSRWDLSRAQRHLELAAGADAARAALRAGASDPAALATLGEWYAFRGADDWAVALLEQARAAGAAVPSLTIARSYWLLDRPADAARDFERALADREAPDAYLALCLSAVRSMSAAPPSTRPATNAARLPSTTGDGR